MYSLTANQYYGLLFGMIAVIFVPIALLQEPKGDSIPPVTLPMFVSEVWDTLQTLNTLYLILFILGVYTLGQLSNNAAVYVQVGVFTKQWT